MTSLLYSDIIINMYIHDIIINMYIHDIIIMSSLLCRYYMSLYNDRSLHQSNHGVSKWASYQLQIIILYDIIIINMYI